MAKKKQDFESCLAQLEEIVEKLESGEETLENSVALYEKGMAISACCEDILLQAEQKMTIIETKK